MKLLEIIRDARDHLRENGRVSLRMLRRQYELDDEALDELIEELVDVQRIARREENVLVWSAESDAVVPGPRSPAPGPRSQGPVRTTATTSPGDQADTRKVVSILFADLAGSTALHERLDPESVRQFMEAYYGAMRTAVEVHGGTVVKFLGDGVMVAFGVPRVAEDDALRAVRAGLAMQLAFGDLVGGVGRADVGRAVPGPPGHESTWAIALRVAINTGEVVVNADNSDVVGDPVNVAARLQQEARDGDVVIGESTQRLVAALVTLEPLGSVTLKGRTEAVRAYRVESLERPAGVIAAAFVGRAAELARLEAAYAAAVEKPATGLAVLLGSPGLGKSRLIDEFKRRLGDTATVITAYCEAAGGATFAPLAGALRAAIPSSATRAKASEGAAPDEDHADAELPPQPPPASQGRDSIEALLPADDAERPRIVAGISALLAGSPASPEETFFVVRRMLAGLAQAKPVVLVIDDLHWAEPLLLDLVEHLVQWGSGVPLLVLVGARPELRDIRSSLVTPGGLVADVLTLAGLDAGAAMRLAANVIGAEDLPAAVAAKVLATSEGNPLFVGELVRMLVQEGALTKEGDRWIPGVALAALEMPPTIHALLAARIERLRPEERSVLERAAVVGRHFSRSAVAELLSRDVVDLDARLEALRRGELIEPDTGWFLGEPVLRFHHVLIRDAAYRRLLKGTRAELHRRFADWVAARSADTADHDETIGWHLEQAHQLLRELGPLDATGRTLGERAAQHLAAAGRRALGRDDLPVAADLLGRAIDRLDVDDAARADLALDWCEALLSAGDVSRAASAIAELARFAGEAAREEADSGRRTADGHPSAPAAGTDGVPSAVRRPPSASEAGLGRLRAWHTCFSAQLTVLTEPQGLQAAADAVAAAAQQLAAEGDAAGEAKAHSVHATALARLGKVGACEAALDQALAAARRAGDRRRANAVLAGAPLAALWGPSPVTRASGRCLDVVRVLRITQGAPAVESVALSCQGVLEALRGRTEAARRMLASSRKMVEDLGIAHRLFEADAFAGRIAAMEGDDATAERLLRGAYEGLRDLGLGIDAARAGALLARALLSLDRVDDAEALSHESEALAGDDLQAAIAWRGVRAEALAKRGEHAAAVELAKAAVAIASATDALLDHADARVALATALRSAGRAAEADVEERRAIELWEAKGATLLAERARGEVESIEAVARTPGQRQARDPSPAATVGAPGLAAEAPSARGGPGTARPTPGRRVRANAAARNAARIAAAMAATDLDATEQELGDSVHVVHHPTGLTYDGPALLESFRRVFQTTKGLAVRLEALATLGDMLCLSRQSASIDSVDDAALSVGAAETETLMLGEVDATGRRSRTEIFAADHLADAIARLYERYAEILPDGSERERAAATARMFGVMLMSPDDVDRVAAVIAPDFESVDHRPLSTWSMRGGGAFLEHLRALREVAADVVIPARDILALRPNALLTRRLHSGTERVGGGVYERPFLVLFAAAADGRLARAEWFDADREAEALARFDALVAGTEPKRPVRPRVRPNAATAIQDRFDAALAARDFDGVAAVVDASHQEIDHPTGSTYGRDSCIASLQRLFRSRQPHYEVERLATLGELLLLVRRRSGASGAASRNYDVGAYESEAIQLFEVNEVGLCCRSEVFAADRIGDAMARLYQRYAEILPEGPQRSRAAAVAQFATVQMAGPAEDMAPLAAVLASDFEGIDHRHLSTWSINGAESYLEHLRALRQVGDNIVFRHSDILALEPGAYLCRVMHSGTERRGGGAYERAFLSISAADAAGRLARMEWFDDDREAEALARFEEIVAGAETRRPVRGRVRPNAATRQLEREWAAIEARDVDALTRFNSGVEVIHHPTGATYGTSEVVALHRGLWRGKNLKLEQEVLATLGDSLALIRRVASHDGVDAKFGSVGPVEVEYVNVVEIDERTQAKRSEIFAGDHLGEAITRLYQRYAELLPEGPERARAAATTRSVRVVAPGRFDLDAYAEVFRSDVAIVDHRVLGLGSSIEPQILFRHMAAAREIGDQLMSRPQEVLALSHDALLLRWLASGVGRESGGAFEWAFLRLFIFDPEGRVARYELFGADREAQALARFDEIVGTGSLSAGAEPKPLIRRRVRANAATRGIERFQSVVAARDGAALAEVFDESLHVLHHPTRATYGRREMLATWRSMIKAERLDVRSQILALLGDRLALQRHFVSIEGLSEAHLAGFGRSEFDEVVLIETDERGRCVHVEIFAADRLSDAVTRLYERHAELLPEGTERERAAATARSVAIWNGPIEPDRLATAMAASVENVDHRNLGTWSERGREEYLRHWRLQGELTAGWALRDDAVLALEANAFLVRRAYFGTVRATGGAFENLLLGLMVFDSDGLLIRHEVWEPDCEAEAIARFEKIAGAAPRRPARRNVRANAASAVVTRFLAAFAARDVAAVAALHSDRVEVTDHRWHATYGREGVLKTWRGMMKPQDAKLRSEPIASLGERLSLDRWFYTSSGGTSGQFDIGEHASEFARLADVDPSGQIQRVELFATDRLDAAVARLYERYAELLPEGAERERAAATARSLAGCGAPIDLDRLAKAVAPSFRQVDHRVLQTWSAQGTEEFLRHYRIQLDLAPDFAFREEEVLALAPDALLVRRTYFGTAVDSGGPFENLILVLLTFGAEGLITRSDVLEPDAEAEALARFEEITGGGEETEREPFANAASRSDAELFRCFNGRDWEGVLACVAPVMVFDERRRLVRNTCDRDVWLEQFRFLFDVPKSHFTSHLRATRGERLALNFHRFEGEVAEGGGPLAMEDHFALHEVDGDGRIVGLVLFDLEDEDAAHAELDARFIAGEGAAQARVLEAAEARRRALASRDWDTLAALHEPDASIRDHRVLGLLDTLVRGREAVVRAQQVLVELAPDTRYRLDHLRLAPSGFLLQVTRLGTREGGTFENSYLRVDGVDEEGRVRDYNVYDPEQLDLALERFAALARGGEAETLPDPFENAAARTDATLYRCFNERDWEGVLACAAPVMVFDERRRLLRNTCDRDVWLEQFRFLFDVPKSRFTSRLRATRGERLALNFHRFDGEVAEGGGPLAVEGHLALHEVDADGRIVGLVLFDLEDEEAAHAELDARFAAGEGARHPRASAWVREFQRAFAARDWEAMAALHAPDQIAVNHRTVGWGTLRGPGAWVPTLQALVELAADAQFRLDHLRTCERGILWQSAWQGTRDGGPFETPLLVATELDDLGRQIRMDVWDADVFGPARARFEELSAGGATPLRFANAASRAERTLMCCFHARDWTGVEACAAADLVFDDRQLLRRLTADRQEWRTMLRFLFDVPARRFDTKLLATRGERLSLHANRFEGEVADGGGPLALDDHLALYEVDGDGRIVAVVLFAEDDEAAAHAELDARLEAAEGAARRGVARRGALEARDWDAFAAGMAPDFTYRDHRLLGWGTVGDAATFVRVVRSIVDLAPDARYREDHVRLSERGDLTQLTLLGTRDGGAFESPMLRVTEVDELGRIRAFDTYDLEDLDRARARFEEIAAPAAATARFENAASRAWREVIAALQQRDVERFGALHPPAFRYRDHRRLVQLDLDRDGYLAFARPLLEMRSTSAALELLATRGERLALVRPTLEIADDSAGPSAVESLLLIETDEHGAIVAYDRYELDDEVAARAELEARWEAGEGAAHAHAAAWNAGFDAAVDRRDWEAAATFLAPAFVAHDHRLVGWGTLRGRTDFLQSLRSMEALSPDARMRGDHTRACHRGSIISSMWVGTRDGGAFESPFLVVSELDADGKVERIDFYDPHHFERAQARFEEIRDGEAPDSLGAFAKGNVVTALLESWPVLDGANSEADWEALRASCAPDMVFEDRQAFARLSGDREMMIASLRERVASGAQAARRVLGTVGERVAVARMLWTGGPADGRFEIEYLTVVEIDEAGRVAAIILFGADNERAAQREAWARWAAIDPVAAPWVELLNEYTEAWNGHDRARLRACFADDFVLEDHRHAGLGRIEGAEAYVDSNVVLWDLAPDQRVGFGWSWPLVERHGIVLNGRREGTLAEGGAFANDYSSLFFATGGRFTRWELFEIDALDIALVRFEELVRSPVEGQSEEDPLIPSSGPIANAGSLDTAPQGGAYSGRSDTPGPRIEGDPLRIPPNAATRTWDRWQAAVTAGDEVAVRTLYNSSHRLEDRRALFRMTVDVDGTVANALYILEGGWRPLRTLLATAGDRLVLQQIVWRTGRADGASEVEMLAVDEMDAEGRFLWTAVFDPDDRAAAEAELFERYVASGGDGIPRGAIEYSRALNERDLARARAGLCDDFVLEDHRHTGLGRQEGGDAYIASIAAAYELTRELTVHPLYTAAIAPHGRVVMVRAAGTNTEGGAFESFYAAFVLYRDERIASFEFFEPAELDTALARLAECRPAVEAARSG